MLGGAISKLTGASTTRALPVQRPTALRPSSSTLPEPRMQPRAVVGVQGCIRAADGVALRAAGADGRQRAVRLFWQQRAHLFVPRLFDAGESAASRTQLR